MSTRGAYRAIHTVLLDGPDYQRLSPPARLALLTIKLSLGSAGIDVLYPAVLAARTGLADTDITSAMSELGCAGWIDVDGNVVWLVRGLAFEPTFAVTNEKHRKAVASHLASLPRRPIVARFRQYYRNWLNSTTDLAMATDSLSNGYQYPIETQETRDNTTTTTTKAPDTPAVASVSGNASALRAGKKKRARPLASPNGVATNWVATLSDEWTAVREGDLPHGQVGKVLGPLVHRVGVADVVAAWAIFCRSDKAQYGLGYFARNFGLFTGDAALSESDIERRDKRKLKAALDAAEAELPLR